MAIQLLKENDRFNTYHQHFLIDGSDDLTSLEANYKCQMGDVAEVVDGTRYIRHSDDYQGEKWELMESSSGGDGGGSTGGGVLVVNMDTETGALDKTWQEIHDALPLVFARDEDTYYLVGCFADDGEYGAVCTIPQPDGNIFSTFVTDSADGYPVAQDG